MEMIEIIKPKTKRPNKLSIDIVVNLPSGQHRIQNLKYDKNGLYYAPTIHEKGVIGIDLHTSYHSTGEIHTKLTRGKLKQATAKFKDGKTEPPHIDTLGVSTPTDKNTEITIQTKQGIPWKSIKDVVEINPNQQNVHNMTNITAIAAKYPVFNKTDADYIFKIDGQATPWIDIRYFFLEPNKEDFLKALIKEIIDRGNNFESRVFSRPRMYESLEKAVLFTNLSPWLAIVLIKFCDKTHSE